MVLNALKLYQIDHNSIDSIQIVIKLALKITNKVTPDIDRQRYY